jgi:hypothetical protein
MYRFSTELLVATSRAHRYAVRDGGSTLRLQRPAIAVDKELRHFETDAATLEIDDEIRSLPFGLYYPDIEIRRSNKGHEKAKLALFSRRDHDATHDD